jgi:hypothetical protein
VGILEWGKTSVYGGELVRNMHGKAYLSMELAIESEVADTGGSTATAVRVVTTTLSSSSSSLTALIAAVLLALVVRW